MMRVHWTAATARRGFGLLAAFLAFLFLAGFAWVQLSPAPDLSERPAQPAMILMTAQGEPFARRGDYREAPIAAASLPQHVIAPFLAIEDRRFYSHGGLDVRGIGRAAIANFSSNEVQQGGSTITQQLAKIAFVGNDRSFTRKLKEAFVALRLERHYSKEEILSAYLNRVYFGDGVYGIGAAARHYFGKDAADLDLNEAAMLAGVINAPSRLAPSRHLEAAQERADVVLAALVDAGHLTEGDLKFVPPAQPEPSIPLLGEAGYFADWIQPQLGDSVAPGYGRVAVPTTLDAGLQQAAAELISKALAGEGKKRGAGQAALVAMRTDGSVVAMVGGRDYTQSQYNRAANAHRQPGSAFKLFVYLAALHAGADARTLVDDLPLSVEGWKPRNFSARYEGSIPLTRAFAQSSNVAAVRLSEYVGRDAVIDAAQSLGLHGKIKPVPSIALGVSPTTLLDLTSAYAAVAGGIYPVTPRGLSSVQDDPFSSRVARQTPMPYHERAELLSMLAAAVESGTGRTARLPIPAYGKTGTTQNSRDAWFVGFAGDLIVGVWVGNDDEKPMKGITGGGLPADIWREFMMNALGDEIAAEEIRKAAEAARAQDEQEWFGRETDPGWWDRRIEHFPRGRWVS